MLELKSPIARIFDGPALLVHRLTELVPSLRSIDIDNLLLSMAEMDPDYVTYLDSEGLLHRHRSLTEEQAWLS